MHNTLQVGHLVVELMCKLNKPVSTGDEQILVEISDDRDSDSVESFVTREQLKSLGDLFIAFSNRVDHET